MASLTFRLKVDNIMKKVRKIAAHCSIVTLSVKTFLSDNLQSTKYDNAEAPIIGRILKKICAFKPTDLHESAIRIAIPDIKKTAATMLNAYLLL